jgi:nicotinate-nucleotide--dimethylbenzimidazole phosphoribosyltransferase
MHFNVPPIHQDVFKAAQDRQHSLAKPFGSLGSLETFSARIAGITGQLYPALSKAVVVFASDNGVWDEGVTPIGKDVTALQSSNMTFGKAGIGVLSAHAGAKLFVVDVGMQEKYESRYIIRRKIRPSTWNITKGPAMTREECEKAMGVGAEMADRCKEQGFNLVGAGEMGVGNTTTSTAVLSVLLGIEPEGITGKGAGLADEAYRNKISVIRRAIEINNPDPSDPIDVLTKIGGFDIAAMVGFYLRCGELGLVTVVDGFIAVAAAVAAARIQPNVKDYLFLSHRSAEPGYDAAAKELGQKPMFDLGMRLGEGTGCPLAFNVLEASVRVLRDMATFAEISIDDSVVADNWEEEKN